MSLCYIRYMIYTYDIMYLYTSYHIIVSTTCQYTFFSVIYKKYNIIVYL